MPTNLPTNIAFKVSNATVDDPLSGIRLLEQNQGEIANLLNETNKAVNEFVVPSATINLADIITAIETMKVSRVIPFSMTEGQVVTFVDNQTITRTGNTFIVSHPRETAKAFAKVMDGNTKQASCDIEFVDNSIIVTFAYAIDSDMMLVVL